MDEMTDEIDTAEGDGEFGDRKYGGDPDVIYGVDADDELDANNSGGKEIADGDGSSCANGKKRHRRKNKGGRHHPKKWKPYTKMTWDERKELEDRESRRANQRHEERFAEGHPVAPYNTTQFIIEDQKINEQIGPSLNADDETMFPKRQVSRDRESRGGGSGSWESSDEFYSSPNDEEIFLEKDFTETYDSIHAERLQSMSKEELVREYIEMEGQIETLQQRAKVARENIENHNVPVPVPVVGIPSQENAQAVLGKLENGKQDAVTDALLGEIEHLRRENKRLVSEKQQLLDRNRTSDLPFKSYSTA